MDESELNLVFALSSLVIVAIISYFALRYVRANQRRYEEYRAAREQFLANFAGTLSADEIEKYKNLPNLQSRISWLEKNHADFISNLPYTIVDFKTALHLDVKLLSHEALVSETELLQRYLDRSEHMSIRSYQEDLKRFERWIEAKTEKGYDREKESSKLWDSLSASDKENLKRERNPVERKKLLVSETSEDTSTYQVDYLYPILITSYIYGDSDGNYGDGGDFSHYDGSSDFGGDSGGDSGGGDGGGGE